MSLSAIRPISSYLRNLKLYHSQQLLKQATRKNVVIFRILQKPMFQAFMVKRDFSSSPITFQNEADENIDEEDGENEDDFDSDKDFIKRYLDPKDRSRVIAPEISMKYMESVAYSTTYGNEPIWTRYRRNFGVYFIFSFHEITISNATEA